MPLRVLHAVHDFLPRHRAGSELYVLTLAQEQVRRGLSATVLCAEYDGSRTHGELTWRLFDEVPVIELVNNWRFGSFEDTYRSAWIDDRLAHVLRATRPHVVHVHNLLNLSFNLPALAKRHGAGVVATLHDFTLVCPSGGQRVHVDEAHVCTEIEPSRCARCFNASPFGTQLALGRLPGARSHGWITRAGALVRRAAPSAFGALWSARPSPAVTPEEVATRLRALDAVFDAVDVFVSPSRALADDLVRFGLPARKVRVADIGYAPLAARPSAPGSRLRIGFAGTLTWHKGPHVLLSAARHVPQARVEIIIHGDPDTFPGYTRQLRADAAPLRNVMWRGPYDAASVGDVLATFDVLAVPSLWPENAPRVVREAFMAGVPVVASRIGGIPEVIEHGVSGLLFEPGSAEGLAACLNRLLEEPALRTRLASAAPPVRSIAEDADGWLHLYRTCVTSAS